jgi:phosphopantetheinyl transferase
MPEFPLHQIEIDEHGKPKLRDGKFYFSISHSWPFIAVVIDTEKETGIDIQTWHPRVADIQHKYLSAEEQEMVGADPKMITLAWCAKESAYKWYGQKGVEFIEELPILNFTQGLECNINIYFLRNKVPQMIFIESIINIDFACTYIANVQDWVIY